MRLYFVLIFLLFNFINSEAQQLVEFRGTGRSGFYSETGLLDKWPEKGPDLFLKIEGMGSGYSQPIVAEGKIFMTGIKKDTMDVLSAYDFDGKLLWETVYGRSWIRTFPESRCTPTYADGKLFVVSGTGQIGCVDSSDGNLNWSVNTVEEYGCEIYTHGDAESPLLYNDVVVYTTGGEKNTLIALFKNDGSLAWKTKSLGGPKSYASSVLINFKGTDIIVAQTANHLIGVHAKNGDIVWSYNLKQYHLLDQGKGGNANPPLFRNGELLVTSGYDHPAIMFSISSDGKSISEKWKNYGLDTHFGGDVLIDGNLYGSNWQNNSKGKWACVNWETGKTNWETDWFNKGSVITADGFLYFLEEKSGNMALIKPNPEKMEIISTFRMKEGDGPYWAHPAIYNGKLFVRHGNVLMVYNILRS